MRLSYILFNEKTMISKTLLFVLIRMKSKYKLKNPTKPSNNLADGCVCVYVSVRISAILELKTNHIHVSNCIPQKSFTETTTTVKRSVFHVCY